MPPAASEPPPAIARLLVQIDQAYDRRSWHGTNLRGSLRGLTVAQAAWRPGTTRHNIWELAVHAAYWKYAVCRRLTGERRGSFPLKGSNWFRRPVESTERAWKSDLALLSDSHVRLRHAVASLPPARLDQSPPGGTSTCFHLIAGVIAHDLYHAGQIQLLKRLAGKR